MGDLAERYGFYSNYSGKPERPLYADSAEALGIADRTGDVWITAPSTPSSGSSGTSSLHYVRIGVRNFTRYC